MNNHITLNDARKQFFAMCDRLDLAPNFHNTRAAIVDIRKAAMRLSNIAERECNGVERYQGNGIWCGTWTDADQARSDKARAVAESKVIAALESCFDTTDFARLEIEFQGDPRGPSVIIHERNGLRRLATFW